MPGIHAAGHHRLELNGRDAGLLRSVEGGEPYGEVVHDAVAMPDAVVGKRIGSVHYADLTIEAGLTPTGPLAELIGATLDGKAPRYDGAVVELDYDYNEVSRLAFRNAVVREVEFPVLDAADKGQAYMTIRLAPEWTRREAGSGVRQSLGLPAKAIQTSNFRVQVDRLGSSFVSNVAPLAVRQLFTESAKDGAALTPAGLEIPDLVLTMREAADWYAWRDDFIVDGVGTERTGTLEYLAPDMKAIARIEFAGLGIHSLVLERAEEGVARGRRIRASMYCENLTFRPPLASSPSPAKSEFRSPSRVEVTAPLERRRQFTVADGP